jgi:mannose-6-phosphate isomerase
MELLFLEPIFKERIWGGTRLHDDFGYTIPSDTTGECWAISAHKNGATHVRNGSFTGMSLADLWVSHPELFQQNGVELVRRDFPLMIKILDAKTDLSVQVHPDDNYACEVENDLGKAECWYVLDANPDSKIVYGHSAANIEEFKNLALHNKWDKLLNSVKVKPGDFFDVPTGTVHALGAGTLILEVQQSSDTTYRLYDYDRRDDNGNLRELHLDKSFAVIKAPHLNTHTVPKVLAMGDSAIITKLTHNKYFQVQKLSVSGSLNYLLDAKYLLICAIDGSAIINGYQVKKGDNFIVPHQVKSLDIVGDITLIISNES